MRSAVTCTSLLLALTLYVNAQETGVGVNSAYSPESGQALSAQQCRILPDTVSASLLLQDPHGNWRMGRLDINTSLLAIKFPSLSEQAQTMNRIAAFVEKAAAPRDRILTDSELAALIARAGDSPETFYLGHDYRVADLATFFTMSRLQGLKLHAKEEQLLRILLTEGAIMGEEEFHPGKILGALITVAHLSSSDLALLKIPANDRILSAAILQHEISHGDFLTRPAYQAQTWRFWNTHLTEAERRQWRKLLLAMGYDTNNESLLVNEMQALLMHTPDARVFSPERLNITKKQLASQRRRFAAAARP